MKKFEPTHCTTRPFHYPERVIPYMFGMTFDSQDFKRSKCSHFLFAIFSIIGRGMKYELVSDGNSPSQLADCCKESYERPGSNYIILSRAELALAFKQELELAPDGLNFIVSG